MNRVMIAALATAVSLSLFTIAIAAEPGGKEPAGALDVKQLTKSWTHSYEEGDGTYRPTGSKKFPPSRFRAVYVFKDEGKCEWLALSPTDAHRMTSGTWKIDEKDPRLIHIYGANKDKPVKSLQVVELKDDLLRIK
jgi:hypothetical protein